MKCKGFFFIMTGSVLLLAALSLSLYNISAEQKADISADQIYVQIEEARKLPEKSVPSMPDNKPFEAVPTEELEDIPDYILNPNMDMPTTTISESFYIGTLDIPAIDKSLPIMKEWSYDGLLYAPGRYAGSIYLNNMVIAAHNYMAHFGAIKNLSQGDEVVFTDVDGNIFKYRVLGIEILNPDEIEEMTTGDWDLTLFTCTYGGAQRVTVRCELTEDIPISAIY